MRRAAAVVPRLPDGRVLVGTRTHAARSWPGTVAFPGGASEPTDEATPLLSGRDLERACALRELFEETRVLRACRGDGTRDDAACARASERIDAGVAFIAALAAERLVLDDRGLTPLALWRTWGASFAVRQFLLPLEHEIAAHDTDELERVHWAHPRDLVSGWRAGETFLIAPIRRVLVALARVSPDARVDEAVAELSQEPSDPERARMDLVDNVCFLNAKTPTLPPATHTNSPLLGRDRCLLVDPATPWPAEQEAFDRWLEAALGSARLQAVFLTHHHHDHAGDAARIAQKYGVPVWAHAETAARVDVPVARHVQADEVLEVDGAAYRAVFTPGHAPGHLCLFDERTRMLIAGDMVAGVGSILIDPPEGHMGTYLASLERLIALAPRGLIPSHGTLMADGTARLIEQRAHRGRRQDAVRAVLPAAPAAPRELVAAVYGPDTPPSMWAFAERSLLAALELCVERGEAVREGERFRRA